jgi:hypothetical protein
MRLNFLSVQPPECSGPSTGDLTSLRTSRLHGWRPWQPLFRKSATRHRLALMTGEIGRHSQADRSSPTRYNKDAL